MEENKSNKLSVSSFFLIIAIIIIIAMGYFIYEFYVEKEVERKENTALQVQVSSLTKKIQKLNTEKDRVKEESNNNSDRNEIVSNKNLSEKLDGIFFNEKSGKNTEYYEFFKSDKRVNYLNESILYYGTYNISNDKVTINLTDKIVVGGDTSESINETKVLKFVNNNILQDENNTNYINKNTLNSAFASENSISVGGNSSEDSWYTFNYNGGVRYSDSTNVLYGTYEINDKIITITFYFSVSTEAPELQQYEGNKILKLNDDGTIRDEEANMNYKGYADGW